MGTPWWSVPRSGDPRSWRSSWWHCGPSAPSTDVQPRAVLFTDFDEFVVEQKEQLRVGIREALDLLASQTIPLVLCSSRTRAEIERMQRALAVRHPFVSENGAALYVPRGYFPFLPAGTRSIGGYDVVVFARPYHDVVQALRRTARMLGVAVEGFSEMSVLEVASACGLSLPEAHLATLREYGEPFRITNGTPASQDRFVAALRREGLTCDNGRDFCYAGAGANKGQAIRTLTAFYRHTCEEIRTIGVSDGRTDTTVLQTVDTAVVVLTPVLNTERLLRKVPQARVTKTAGPSGWKEAIFATVTSQP